MPSGNLTLLPAVQWELGESGVPTPSIWGDVIHTCAVPAPGGLTSIQLQAEGWLPTQELLFSKQTAAWLESDPLPASYLCSPRAWAFPYQCADAVALLSTLPPSSQGPEGPCLMS